MEMKVLFLFFKHKSNSNRGVQIEASKIYFQAGL